MVACSIAFIGNDIGVVYMGGDILASSSHLKLLLTEDDKAAIKHMYNNLDPTKFWYFDASRDQEAAETKMNDMHLSMHTTS